MNIKFFGNEKALKKRNIKAFRFTKGKFAIDVYPLSEKLFSKVGDLFNVTFKEVCVHDPEADDNNLDFYLEFSRDKGLHKFMSSATKVEAVFKHRPPVEIDNLLFREV